MAKSVFVAHRSWFPRRFGIATSLRTAIAVCTLGSIAINVAALRTAFLSLTLLKEVVTPAPDCKKTH